MEVILTTATFILLAAILSSYGTFLPEALRGRLSLPRPWYWPVMNAYIPTLAYVLGLAAARSTGTPTAVGPTLLLMVFVLPAVGAWIGNLLWRKTLRDIGGIPS